MMTDARQYRAGLLKIRDTPLEDGVCRWCKVYPHTHACPAAIAASCLVFPLPLAPPSVGASADADALRAMAERLKALRDLPHAERVKWLQDNGLMP